jgi:hypothetical protein
MTERLEPRRLGDCFGAHRQLADVASSLARRLMPLHDDADLLMLGANCLRMAAHSALQSSDERQALRSWRECSLAERQIRLATFRALRDGCIDASEYDDLFRLAARVARVREDERQRLRRQLQRLDLL